jgi:RNA polymerase sigma factor (sigma-70 family)
MAKEELRRDGISVNPQYLDHFGTSKAIWHETPEEIEAGLAWGQEKERLLRHLRKEMRRRLTKRERRCVELYFFRGLTYSEAGKATKTNPSSVHRAVHRGLRKLRCAAESGNVSSAAFKRKVK